MYLSIFHKAKCSEIILTRIVKILCPRAESGIILFAWNMAIKAHFLSISITEGFKKIYFYMEILSLYYGEKSSLKS